MTMLAPNRYAGHRFPPTRSGYISVSRSSLKFGQAFANAIRRRLPQPGDKWHLDDAVLVDRPPQPVLFAADRDHDFMSVTITRGARLCRFNRLRSNRLAAAL